MDKRRTRLLKGFYENVLLNGILPFWLKRCEDREYGGYLNCFDNKGEHLVSYDKYTWSQGRFLWVFSRLASTKAPLFSSDERKEFLRLAETGYRFLRDHCLMDCDDVRCVYLMERDGSPKHVEGWEELDMSIYADCFVVIGMSTYACASGCREAYEFGLKVYESILSRVSEGKFNTLPYPLSSQYRAHGIPMILNNVTKELLDAATVFEPSRKALLMERMTGFAKDVICNFVDSDYAIHEVISSADNCFIDGLLGQHVNPGHTIEDMWFVYDAAKLSGDASLIETGSKVVKRAFELGWDKQMGGILHYVMTDGSMASSCDPEGLAEPTVRQVLGGWGDKLWWVHSEALYTSLLYYFETGDQAFLDMHDTVFDYVFDKFPNRDPETGEWIQILTREGLPQEKVVALPVKDPFHIIRNMLLICELLDRVEAGPGC